MDTDSSESEDDTYKNDINYAAGCFLCGSQRKDVKRSATSSQFVRKIFEVCWLQKWTAYFDEAYKRLLGVDVKAPQLRYHDNCRYFNYA